MRKKSTIWFKYNTKNVDHFRPEKYFIFEKKSRECSAASTNYNTLILTNNKPGARVSRRMLVSIIRQRIRMHAPRPRAI